MSELEGRGAAWTEERGTSEPAGRVAAWTEERGTSDEGRRRLIGAPESSGRESTSDEGRRCLKAPRRRPRAERRVPPIIRPAVSLIWAGTPRPGVSRLTSDL